MTAAQRARQVRTLEHVLTARAATDRQTAEGAEADLAAELSQLSGPDLFELQRALNRLQYVVDLELRSRP